MKRSRPPDVDIHDSEGQDRRGESLMETVPDIGTLPVPTMIAVVAVAIAVGTLYCFLGYRTMKFVLALTGFVLAGAVAGALGAWLSQGQALIALAAAALGGIAGGMALLFLSRTGIFFMGLMAAALVAQALLSDRGEPWVMWAVIGAARGRLPSSPGRTRRPH